VNAQSLALGAAAVLNKIDMPPQDAAYCIKPVQALAITGTWLAAIGRASRYCSGVTPENSRNSRLKWGWSL
jgi:hypothetical protein